MLLTKQEKIIVLLQMKEYLHRMYDSQILYMTRYDYKVDGDTYKQDINQLRGYKILADYCNKEIKALSHKPKLSLFDKWLNKQFIREFMNYERKNK